MKEIVQFAAGLALLLIGLWVYLRVIFILLGPAMEIMNAG